jgi:hypothetical protein
MKILEMQEKELHNVMESIKKRTKPNFSLNETSKQVKELNK